MSPTSTPQPDSHPAPSCKAPIYNVSDSDTAITHVQVFGERRSGTNYAVSLLQKNLPLRRTHLYGWKHGFPVMPVIPARVLFVAMVRDPFDWVRSFYANPFEARRDLLDLPFSEFIRAEWHGVFRPRRQDWAKWGYGERSPKFGAGEELQLDRHPITGLPFANILELRRVKLQGHLSLAARGANCIVIRYEDLRDDPEEAIGSIRSIFGIEGGAESFVPVTGRASPTRAGGRSAPPFAEWTTDDLSHVRDGLDPLLEARLGYDAKRI